jgi:hypothetical protein
MRIANSVLVVLLGLGVSSAFACPEAKKKGGCKKPCGAKSVKTVSAKSVDDGRSEVGAKTKKGGCHKHVASLTSDKKAPCQHGGKVTSGKSGCPIEAKTHAILTSMPSVKYRVGDEVTGCSKSAAAISEKSHKPIRYVVRTSTFDNERDATAKLTSLMQEELDSLQTIQYVVDDKPYGCGGSAAKAAARHHQKVMYRVGGVEFESQEDAEDALTAIEHAVKEVKLTYKVGDESYCCSKTAAAKAKETHKELTYVVGDTSTCCEKTAQINLAQAKVKAIVEAAMRTALSM